MIKYHFFGKDCLINKALSDYTDLNHNLAKQNFCLTNPVVFVNQIHSNEVLVISNQNQIHSINNRPSADAIVTNLANLTIGIFTADYIPVIFSDEKTIAIAHCGWRGAFGDIIKNTIAKMIELGAKIDNIQAIIGPCIRQKSYQISSEFYNNFLNEKRSNSKFFISDGLEHFLFDLPGYVKEKLMNEGLKNIIDDEIDTYSDQEKFFSYRRSTHLLEKDCGRNVSVVQI